MPARVTFRAATEAELIGALLKDAQYWPAEVLLKIWKTPAQLVATVECGSVPDGSIIEEYIDDAARDRAWGFDESELEELGNADAADCFDEDELREMYEESTSSLLGALNEGLHIGHDLAELLRQWLASFARGVRTVWIARRAGYYQLGGLPDNFSDDKAFELWREAFIDELNRRLDEYWDLSAYDDADVLLDEVYELRAENARLKREVKELKQRENDGSQ